MCWVVSIRLHAANARARAPSVNYGRTVRRRRDAAMVVNIRGGVFQQFYSNLIVHIVLRVPLPTCDLTAGLISQSGL